MLLPAQAIAGCALEQRLLVPRREWLADPSAQGLAFENVVLRTGEHTSVHAWFIPAADSAGRTAMICHGNAANISFYHPFHRLLHDAGWNVLAFDYRGFGRSEGELDLGGLFEDANAALDHLLARPDVDRAHIAVVGFSLGAIVALRTMATRPEPFAYVVEDAMSPHEVLREQVGGLLAWWLELWSLPGGIEPAPNAAATARPGLLLVGARDDSLRQHLAAAAAARGPVQVWVMPDAGHVPSGMLAHDGEYQGAFARFLAAAAAGRVPRIVATPGAWRDGALAVHVARVDGAGGRSAVELCLVPASGAPWFERRWLDADEATWTVRAPEPPTFVTAFAYTQVEDDGCGGWRAAPGPLTPASLLVPLLQVIADDAAVAADPLPRARNFAAILREFEAEHGRWPPQAAAELVPALLTVGRALAAHADAEHVAIARTLLQRCVDAAPAVPALHYWPSERYVAGFRHQDAVGEARRLLDALPAPR